MIESYLEILADRLCGPRPQFKPAQIRVGDPITMPSAAERQELVRVSEWRRSTAWHSLRRDLTAKHTIALGYRTRDDDGFWIAEIIPPRFWVDAGLRHGFNLASNEDRQYERVRILDRSQTNQSQPNTPVNELTVNELGPGIPAGPWKRGMESNEEYRQAAIAHCASTEPRKWFRTKPDARRAAYFEFLKDERELVAEELRGFDIKSWENSETEFKRVRGLLRPQNS